MGIFTTLVYWEIVTNFGILRVLRFRVLLCSAGRGIVFAAFFYTSDVAGVTVECAAMSSREIVFFDFSIFPAISRRSALTRVQSGWLGSGHRLHRLAGQNFPSRRSLLCLAAADRQLVRGSGSTGLAMATWRAWNALHVFPRRVPWPVLEGGWIGGPGISLFSIVARLDSPL